MSILFYFFNFLELFGNLQKNFYKAFINFGVTFEVFINFGLIFLELLLNVFYEFYWVGNRSEIEEWHLKRDEQGGEYKISESIHCYTKHLSKVTVTITISPFYLIPFQFVYGVDIKHALNVCLS